VFVAVAAGERGEFRGDAGVTGDHVVQVVVAHLDVEEAVELLLEFGGGPGEESGEAGQLVEQGGVGGGRGLGGEFAESGVDVGAFGFEFAEPGQDARPERSDSRIVGA